MISRGIASVFSPKQGFDVTIRVYLSSDVLELHMKAPESYLFQPI